MTTGLHSDKSTGRDELGRQVFAVTFARIIQTCDTPLTIALYGDWGAGKTSLMSMIQARLQTTTCRCVWFDAWTHQDDETPALALLHSVVGQLGLGEHGRKLLAVIATTFGSMLMKATANINAEDVAKLAERYEADRFQVRDTRSRLREYFQELVKQARGGSNSRLVIFIDDLDRCVPSAALAVLEALKIHLGMEGCVFVIGADKAALERVLESRFGALDCRRYLDKIVQLPFQIPPIPTDSLRVYVSRLLPAALKSCQPLLVAGLGGNPRSVKRFINMLVLNHELAETIQIEGYDPKILAILLLLQHHDPARYWLVATEPALLQQIVRDAANEPNADLKPVFALAGALPDDIAPYVHLTDVTGVGETRQPNKEFLRLMLPDAQLATVVGSEPRTRIELTKRIWQYIQRNGLQDPARRQLINADENLLPIFGRPQVSMFEMTRQINSHLKPLDAFGTVERSDLESPGDAGDA